MSTIRCWKSLRPYIVVAPLAGAMFLPCLLAIPIVDLPLPYPFAPAMPARSKKMNRTLPLDNHPLPCYHSARIPAFSTKGHIMPQTQLETYITENEKRFLED